MATADNMTDSGNLSGGATQAPGGEIARASLRGCEVARASCRPRVAARELPPASCRPRVAARELARVTGEGS